MDKEAKKSLNDDAGERRLGVDRRRFSYTYHIPERRTGHDRRDDDDGEQSTAGASEPSDETALRTKH
jgi:hypothetical protein